MQAFITTRILEYIGSREDIESTLAHSTPLNGVFRPRANLQIRSRVEEPLLRPFSGEALAAGDVCPPRTYDAFKDAYPERLEAQAQEIERLRILMHQVDELAQSIPAHCASIVDLSEIADNLRAVAQSGFAFPAGDELQDADAG